MKYKLGKIFGDSIVTVKRRQFHEVSESHGDFRSRMAFFLAAFVVSFLIIIFQLVRLTVLQGSYYSLLSQGNRIKETSK